MKTRRSEFRYLIDTPVDCEPAESYMGARTAARLLSRKHRRATVLAITDTGLQYPELVGQVRFEDGVQADPEGRVK